MVQIVAWVWERQNAYSSDGAIKATKPMLMASRSSTGWTLRRSSPPSNIKWDELVAVLKHLGYKVIMNSGSRRKFHHAEKDNVISLHKPHPGNEVKPCYIREVRETLEEIGLI